MEIRTVEERREKAPEPPVKAPEQRGLKATFSEIYTEHKRLFMMMIALLVLGVLMFLIGFLSLDKAGGTLRVGYADIGSYQGGEWTEMQSNSGYVAGKWTDMLIFPLMGLLVAVMHDLIVLKLYRRRGEGAARVFVVISMLIIAGVGIAMFRLLGEG